MWNHLNSISRRIVQAALVSLCLLSLSSVSMACEVCGLPAHFEALTQSISELQNKDDAKPVQSEKEAKKREETVKEETDEQDLDFHGESPVDDTVSVW